MTPTVTRRSSFFEPFTIHPGERRLVVVNTHSQFHSDTQLYLVAASVSHAWQSRRELALDGHVNRYMQMNVMPDGKGARGTTLTCPK